MGVGMGTGEYLVVGVAMLGAVRLHIGLARLGERRLGTRRRVGIVLFCHWRRAGGITDARHVVFSGYDGVGALELGHG